MFTITATHKHTNTRRTNTSITNRYLKRTQKTFECFEDGTTECKRWIKSRKLHRINSPAIISYFKNGTIRYEAWYRDGELHRLNAPARIQYFENGTWSESCYKDGNYYRLGAPAIIRYFENGTIEYEEWFKDGELII